MECVSVMRGEKGGREAGSTFRKKQKGGRKGGTGNLRPQGKGISALRFHTGDIKKLRG